MLYDRPPFARDFLKLSMTVPRRLAMSLEYLLTTGALVIAFLTVVTLLMKALVGSMAIKTFLFSLPVG